jgi:hypothetical protein
VRLGRRVGAGHTGDGRGLDDLLVELGGHQPAPAGVDVDERVAHRAQQVAELIGVAQAARAGEHPRVGLLDEVLGLVRAAAQPKRGAVEPVDVIAEALRVQVSVGFEGSWHGGHSRPRGAYAPSVT